MYTRHWPSLINLLSFCTVSNLSFNPLLQNKMRNTLLLASFLLVLSSCSDRLLTPALEPSTGKLPVKSTLKPYAVLTEKTINLNEYSQFLVVRPNGNLMKGVSDSDNYSKYLLESLILIGGFENYYDTRGLESYVIEKNLTEEVSDISNNIGLFKLGKHVGKFLLCEAEITYEGSFVSSLDYKVSNPANNEVLFHLKHFGYGGNGLERTLFNPVLNRFSDWVKANKG